MIYLVLEYLVETHVTQLTRSLRVLRLGHPLRRNLLTIPISNTTGSIGG